MSAEVGINRRAVVTGLISAPLLTQRSLADELLSPPIKLIVPFGVGSIVDIAKHILVADLIALARNIEEGEL